MLFLNGYLFKIFVAAKFSLFAVSKNQGKENDKSNSSANLLLKRFTLQVEDLHLSDATPTDGADTDDSDDNQVEEDSSAQNGDLDEWNFRESILKCLYSKDTKYPASIILNYF